MQVILLQDVKGLGKKYEVKNASGGHVRNFLLPRKLVMSATKENLSRLEILKKNFQAEEAGLLSRLQEIVKHIEEHPLEFDLAADEHGNLYGAVTKEAVLKALREHAYFGKERVDINLEKPIKTIGDYSAEVDLKKGIKTTLKIIVRAEK